MKMRNWSRKVTLKETLRKAEDWSGEVYFDGDQHKLVLKQERLEAREKLLTSLADSTEHTSLTILQLARELTQR